MKENYEALKMEVIAFEGDILTATATNGPDYNIIQTSGDGRITVPQEGQPPVGTVVKPAP